jgi:hypothetical protein
MLAGAVNDMAACPRHYWTSRTSTPSLISAMTQHMRMDRVAQPSRLASCASNVLHHIDRQRPTAFCLEHRRAIGCSEAGGCTDDDLRAVSGPGRPPVAHAPPGQVGLARMGDWRCQIGGGANARRATADMQQCPTAPQGWNEKTSMNWRALVDSNHRPTA